jgi:hypothetical protein
LASRDSADAKDRLDGAALLRILERTLDVLELAVTNESFERELAGAIPVDELRNEELRHRVALDDSATLVISAPTLSTIPEPS